MLPMWCLKLLKQVLVINLLLVSSGCLPLNAYLYIVPDPKDLDRFREEYKEVKHAETCFSFPEKKPGQNIYLTNWNPMVPLQVGELTDFLESHKAKRFLVIKSDTIVYDYIGEKVDPYVPLPSFSIAKTFVATSLACAIQQGYIASVDEPVQKYLPELNYHEYFKSLTINHLLNQKSGIRSTVRNLSFAYYGNIEQVLWDIEFRARPGERLEYININSTLLSLIVERATGQDLYQYFSKNIWSKIGTCYYSLWAYDDDSKHTRGLSGFVGSVYDFAKFGKLYMDKGQWQGQQVLDSNWVVESTRPVNSLGDAVGYNNTWFIGDRQVGDYCAYGMYRQQIYINPEKNVIIVALMDFKHANLSLRWWQAMRQIAEQL